MTSQQVAACPCRVQHLPCHHQNILACLDAISAPPPPPPPSQFLLTDFTFEIYIGLKDIQLLWKFCEDTTRADAGKVAIAAEKQS